MRRAILGPFASFGETARARGWRRFRNTEHRSLAWLRLVFSSSARRQKLRSATFTLSPMKVSEHRASKLGLASFGFFQQRAAPGIAHFAFRGPRVSRTHPIEAWPGFVWRKWVLTCRAGSRFPQGGHRRPSSPVRRMNHGISPSFGRAAWRGVGFVWSSRGMEPLEPRCGASRRLASARSGVGGDFRMFTFTNKKDGLVRWSCSSHLLS